MALPEDINLAWLDSQLQQAVDALATSGEVTSARELLRQSMGEHDRRELYANVLGEAAAQHLATLRTYAEQAPGDPHWWLLLGSAFKAAAWTARGAATIQHTSAERIRELVDLSDRSRHALHQAARLAPQDPVPWTLLQNIAKVRSIHRSEPHEVWQRLQALAPDSFMGNHERLSVLCRKWYGSTEQMLEFMRERCASVDDGHPLWSLTPQAYIEVWVDSHMVGNVVKRVYRAMTYRPLKRRAARTEVDAASDRILASQAYANHPWAMMAHQMFGAYYIKAGARDRARVHLQRAGDRASIWPWGYFGGQSQDELNDARRAAGLA